MSEVIIHSFDGHDTKLDNVSAFMLDLLEPGGIDTSLASGTPHEIMAAPDMDQNRVAALMRAAGGISIEL